MADVMEKCYLISEAAKLVGVENHALRYWEEELGLPIRRNELGHRFYTEEDVEQLVQIRRMKEQGLQLKAIRAVMSEREVVIWSAEKAQNEHMVERIRQDAASSEEENGMEKKMDFVTVAENEQIQKESKAVRLQMLLHSMIAQAVQENNEDLMKRIRENNSELTERIRESVIKELDYQFRVQEEEQERRNQEQIAREEEHYRQLDERLREYRGHRNQKKKADKTEIKKQRKMARQEKKVRKAEKVPREKRRFLLGVKKGDTLETS